MTLYYANPCSQSVSAAIRAGSLGFIDTPRQGNRRPPGVRWIADNGCFSDRWDANTWWTWLTSHAGDAHRCSFAVAPDVVGDAWSTHCRSMPWLPRIRALGYRAAYVLQDGVHGKRLPWGWFDALFIGGSTDFKLGPMARAIVWTAKRHGIHVHMGRVNSARRYRYAQDIGCDSVDGTYLTYGPDQNLPRLTGWMHPTLSEAAS